MAFGGCYYLIPLITHSSTPVELSFNSITKPSTDVPDIGFGLADTINHRGNSVYYRTSGTTRFTKNTSATAWSHSYNGSGLSAPNVLLKHIITVNSLSFNYKVIRTDTNAILWDYSNNFDSNLDGKTLGIITGWGSSTHNINNIKVKTL